jgi:hypothetical protein
VQTNNRDNFLSTDFGLKEFNYFTPSTKKAQTDQGPGGDVFVEATV